VYQEAVQMLYATKTFAFWDLRTVEVFRRSVSLANWRTIREVELYAAFYRRDDIDHAIEARSLLQLEAWPGACDALA
jgi:hypothetical protein